MSFVVGQIVFTASCRQMANLFCSDFLCSAGIWFIRARMPPMMRLRSYVRSLPLTRLANFSAGSVLIFWLPVAVMLPVCDGLPVVGAAFPNCGSIIRAVCFLK